MTRAGPKTFKRNYNFTKHISKCFRCGVAFVDGDQIMIRKRGPSFNKEWGMGMRLSVVEQIKRLTSRHARAYHVETCYYAEAIATK